MIANVRAKYENGVLTLLEPLDLEEANSRLYAIIAAIEREGRGDGDERYLQLQPIAWAAEFPIAVSPIIPAAENGSTSGRVPAAS